MEKFLNELYLRLTLATPDFFLKLRKVLLTIATLCGILVTSGVDFDIFGFNVAKIAALVTGGAGIITFLIVKDSDKLNDLLTKKVS